MTWVRAEDEGDDETIIDGDGNNKLDTYPYRAAYSPLRMDETLSNRFLTDDDETTAAESNFLEWDDWSMSFGWVYNVV